MQGTLLPCLFFLYSFDLQVSYFSLAIIFSKSKLLAFLSIFPPLYCCHYQAFLGIPFPQKTKEVSNAPTLLLLWIFLSNCFSVRSSSSQVMGKALYSIVLSSHWLIPPYHNSLLYNFKMESHHYSYLKALLMEKRFYWKLNLFRK